MTVATRVGRVHAIDCGVRVHSGFSVTSAVVVHCRVVEDGPIGGVCVRSSWWVLAWVRSSPAVVRVPLGARDPAQLDQDLTRAPA